MKDYNTTFSTGAAPIPQLDGHAVTASSFQVLKEVVEAKSRKLATRWTFESDSTDRIFILRRGDNDKES